MKMIKILGAFLILFGLSAGASYYLLVPAPKVAEKKEDGKGKEGEEKKDADHGPKAEPGKQPQLGSPNESEITKTSQMPVALPSDKPLSLESILQLSEGIRQKEQQLNEREKVRLREEQRIGLMFEDLKREQQELMALGETIDAKLASAQQVLEQIRQERAGLQAEKQQIAAAKKEADPNAKDKEAEEAEKLNKVKGWFNSLEPEQAARFIKEFSNNGELEFACKLLQSLDPKKSAKILAALDDAPLAASIVSRIGNPGN
jgi:chromosome segregation ATPase